MKPLTAVLAVALIALSPRGFAQATAFTYQGRLSSAGVFATGPYDMRAILYNSELGGAPVGPIITNLAVPVNNGLFTTPLDFGPGLFDGSGRWLELSVRPARDPVFTVLIPRQALNPTPYALYALTPAGPKGDTGDTGEAGLPGAVGPGGPQGVKGDQGDTGPAGVQGPQGLPGSADAWSRTGNSGTSPAINFVGTTDAAPLVLRAGNRQVFRLEGDASGLRIIGGNTNSISTASTNSSILGGRENVIAASAHESTIVGGVQNVVQIKQRSAFIGGGARNEIRQDNEHAVIVGGRDNSIGTNTVISVVVGGGENRMADNVDGGLMVGGFRNDILGSPNPNRREVAPILLGGSDNEIGWESSWATILGGDNNRIGTNCPSAVIAAGTNNLVANNCGFSFAAGRRARVNHVGAVVFSDSQNADFGSAAADSFNVRAAGGVHLSSDTSQFFGSDVRQMLNLWSTEYGIGVQASTLYFRTGTGNHFSWFSGGSHVDTAMNPGAGGVEIMRLDSTGLRVNGTFVSASDRNLKENFRAVNPREVLDKIVALPISAWNYKQDPTSRHLGPMAQDFYAAFGMGPDDKHIATVDADGVALAAIQGLNQKVDAQSAALRERDELIAKLESELGDLRRLIRDELAAARSQRP